MKPNHRDESTSALQLVRFRYLSESLADSAVLPGHSRISPKHPERLQRIASLADVPFTRTQTQVRRFRIKVGFSDSDSELGIPTFHVIRAQTIRHLAFDKSRTPKRCISNIPTFHHLVRIIRNFNFFVLC